MQLQVHTLEPSRTRQWPPSLPVQTMTLVMVVEPSTASWDRAVSMAFVPGKLSWYNYRAVVGAYIMLVKNDEGVNKCCDSILRTQH